MRVVNLISLFILIIFNFLPVPEGLTKSAIMVIGMFFAILVQWLSSRIDTPSIILIVLVGMLPEIGMKNAFITSFGNETFAFLLFTFLCVSVVSRTEFIKRCAIFFMTSKIARKGAWYFIASVFVSIIVIGSFVSPTVLFVVFLPIITEILEISGIKKGEKIGEVLMLGLAFLVSVSSGMTPIAHVFSIMAINFYKTATGKDIEYYKYMMFAIPIGIVVSILLFVVFKYIIKPDVSKLENLDYDKLRKGLREVTKQEIYSVIIFVIVIFLWIMPSIFKNIEVFKYISSLGTAFPPAVGIFLYSIIEIDKKPLIDFKVDINNVAWASLIMAASTLCIGSAMTNKDIGITDYVINTFSPMLNNINPIYLVLLITIWACIQTNLSSNIVTVTVVSTVSLPIMQAMNGISMETVVAIIGLMSSFAFATPPAMPHIAMAIASGYTNAKNTLKYGSILMIISIMVVMCFYNFGKYIF